MLKHVEHACIYIYFALIFFFYILPLTTVDIRKIKLPSRVFFVMPRNCGKIRLELPVLTSSDRLFTYIFPAYIKALYVAHHKSMDRFYDLYFLIC